MHALAVQVVHMQWYTHAEVYTYAWYVHALAVQAVHMQWYMHAVV